MDDNVGVSSRTATVVNGGVYKRYAFMLQQV